MSTGNSYMIAFIKDCEREVNMIKGIGVDIIEIKRIENLVGKNQRFTERILTERERAAYELLTDRRKSEFLAGRFAAKEAFSKAMGTGIGKGLQFTDMEVVQDSRGKPYFSLPFTEGVHLSISHSREYAVAQVIIESSSS
jgi:holo-[acyl-carrier protein] synthase